ncbi:unnamed protein product [Adineta steineri]|uniref:Peptidase S9 prolyl oligopeptidase catalytic domain-containing protein n=1 Tax=Adineta steineri TaxID=433720 RepID=A0A815KLU7_9BILA|nr:unnamed protein product [Adineta steineri]CAF4126595.1 unnamed protein product [Adineta steineri]
MNHRFRAHVNHKRTFDLREMAYAIEELWFTEHDSGGFTQYKNPKAFEKFDPIHHIANWSQPMLVIQGGRDYRVLDTQSRDRHRACFLALPCPVPCCTLP